MPRVYVRKFDWGEARQLYATGAWTLTGLARRYGVSRSAVKRVVDDEYRDRLDRRAREAIRSGTCELCGKEHITSDWHRRAAAKVQGVEFDGRVLCASCRYRVRRKPLLVSETGERLVECSSCRQAKPVAEFPPTIGRRIREGRAVYGCNSACRVCQAEARRRYREAHKVPCERCGQAAEGKGRANTRSGPNGTRIRLDPNRPYLCADCGRQQAAEVMRTPAMRERMSRIKRRVAA